MIDARTPSLDTIAASGDDVLRDTRHAEAVASLDGSPVPALLDAVRALQSVLLSANPRALRAQVGWLGRLLGRDLVLESEGRALRERLRVLVHDAEARLGVFARFDASIAGHEQRLLGGIGALDAALARLAAIPRDAVDDVRADAIERRRQHLLTLQHAWRITAAHLALARLNHRQLAQRIQPMLPLVQVLLAQERVAGAARDDRDGLQSASAALASANALLAGYSHPHPAPPEHAP
jgi:hypothetical protein